MNERPKCDGTAYCFLPSLFVECTTLSIEEEADQAVVYLLRAINQRVSRQSGVFIKNNDVISEAEVEELVDPLSGTNLVPIEIPQYHKLPILEMLDEYDTNSHGIFPNLDGLSRYINSQTSEIVRKRQLRDSN